MSSRQVFAILALAALVGSVSGQYDYQKKGYNPPLLTGATRCVKGVAGNTPALCPNGVPLTDEGKPGSTACVTRTTGGTSYEGVLSLMYPAPVAGVCQTDTDCGTNPGVICAAQGPVSAYANMCFPLAPSTCPFTGDTINSTAVTAAGRRLLMA